jgi:hypothetical protein
MLFPAGLAGSQPAGMANVASGGPFTGANTVTPEIICSGCALIELPGGPVGHSAREDRQTGPAHKNC